MAQFMTPEFWLAVGQIIMIDILLGGDNAVVIALACRKLPPQQRTKGILWGTAGAIILRVILIFFALTLLAIPFLKLVGAVLLVWIGIKLLMPEEEEGHSNIEGSDRLWGAVKTVIIADLVMSVDNVIAIAGAAETAGGDHTMPLVIFGLLVSIPIIVWGSQLVIRLMDRFPIIITVGGMLLGWIAGTMAVSDPALVNPDTFPQFPKLTPSNALKYSAGVAGALLVLLVGKLLASRAMARRASVIEAHPPRPVGRLQSMMIAVDGSESAAHAIRAALSLRDELAQPQALKLHLVNVQRPVSGDVSSFVDAGSLEEYHREQSETAMEPARALLRAAGAVVEEHRAVGQPGATIAELAERLRCDLIVMGATGLGTHGAGLPGSVVRSTLEHARVPVLIAR
jgi:YjbE family integral membrane protein